MADGEELRAQKRGHVRDRPRYAVRLVQQGPPHQEAPRLVEESFRRVAHGKIRGETGPEEELAGRDGGHGAVAVVHEADLPFLHHIDGRALNPRVPALPQHPPLDRQLRHQPVEGK